METVRSIKSYEWGQHHGLMLDKRGRVYATGRMMYGVCGLSEKVTPDKRISNPIQITLGLPMYSRGSEVVQVKCGRFHSLAVTRRGNIYSWGEGANCRLGLGFIEKTQ